ncbi:hypothetical protein L2E82_28082 [Cichorium intybus]|uniref:Uncharacterized protein n=1 Tax=Cichorium intybus TaxID=13427 RepID=A0ACB9CUT3_CICIN|nr:hypothetical protein L2E82_28082 [Cichorium intybus]
MHLIPYAQVTPFTLAEKSMTRIRLCLGRYCALDQLTLNRPACTSPSVPSAVDCNTSPIADRLEMLNLRHTSTMDYSWYLHIVENKTLPRIVVLNNLFWFR